MNEICVNQRDYLTKKRLGGIPEKKASLSKLSREKVKPMGPRGDQGGEGVLATYEHIVRGRTPREPVGKDPRVRGRQFGEKPTGKNRDLPFYS